MDEIQREVQFKRYSIGLVLLEHGLSLAASSFAVAEVYYWNQKFENYFLQPSSHLLNCNSSHAPDPCCSLLLPFEALYPRSLQLYHIVFLLSFGTIIFGIGLFWKLQSAISEDDFPKSVNCYNCVGWLLHGLNCVLFGLSTSRSYYSTTDPDVQLACNNYLQHNKQNLTLFNCLSEIGLCPRYRQSVVYLIFMIINFLLHVPAVLVPQVIMNRNQPGRQAGQEIPTRDGPDGSADPNRTRTSNPSRRRWVDPEFLCFLRNKVAKDENNINADSEVAAQC